MNLKVYYEEIDGEIRPMWMLLPARTEKEYETYTINAPFERFYPEDFYDSLKIITVTQAAMTRNPYVDQQIQIHIPTVQSDLCKQGIYQNAIYDADYFLVRMDDLEEVLQFDIRNVFHLYFE